MQFYLIDSPPGGKSLTLGIKEINQTMVEAIVHALNQDPDVKMVRFIDSHPELEDQRLIIETNKGDAKQKLIDAANYVSKYFSDDLPSSRKTVTKVKGNTDKNKGYGVDGDTPKGYGVDGDTN